MELWQQLNSLPPEEARSRLQRCCGSTRWVERMLRRRPFENQRLLHAIAREEWFALSKDDWLEAFERHPRIGDRAALATRFASTRHLSQREQAAVNGAPETVLDALAAANRAYEEEFGYIFIVCASGRTADEMLELLRARLENEPAVEIQIAAEEQAKITALRLDSLA